jgi:D-glycero-alpha-D-manno-heptose-7-phosphate kinase
VIVARTPLRISFVGGGSDLPAFYRHGCGGVVSVAIDKYVYCIAHPPMDGRIHVRGLRPQVVDAAEELEDPLVRESMQLLRIRGGVQVATIEDVPPGTGLGSSSAFTVSLLHALHAYRGTAPEPSRLARQAALVEIDLAGRPVGRQDHYAVAFGGLNYIRFERTGRVSVSKIACSPATVAALRARLMLFYVGGARDARTILCEQGRLMERPEAYRRVAAMVELAASLREELVGGRVDSIGEILAAGWELKRRLLNGISNRVVDEAYAAALRAGAAGGKLLGAGGGGFLLVACDPARRAKVREALRDLHEADFGFSDAGSTILAGDAPAVRPARARSAPPQTNAAAC